MTTDTSQLCFENEQEMCAIPAQTSTLDPACSKRLKSKYTRWMKATEQQQKKDPFSV